MAQLSAADRAKLPDRSFAYVDSRGQRRLPVFDASHVRNALARFNQVDFESERAREQALVRLLRAAKKFRIVPVGFISSQLKSERERGADREGDATELPTGFVTMLMTDIEGSTTLLDRLGDAYGELLTEVEAIQRAAVHRCDGSVVETRADELFAVFESPRSALEAAISIQRNLDAHEWRVKVPVRVRLGIHAGYPTPRDANYIGMAVHTTARITEAAHGGQIVISGDTKLALTGMTPEGVRFKKLGDHQLRGIPERQDLVQVAAPGLAGRFPPLRI
ncbi:MAG: adenylate/guanylate cyclase domain-containing protein [Ilumatobacteraceae bacterium]